MTRCDRPAYTATRVSGGCYVLNGRGAPVDCLTPQAVAVNQSSWSAMKQMFR
jgi:hypothetical protein